MLPKSSFGVSTTIELPVQNTLRAVSFFEVEVHIVRGLDMGVIGATNVDCLGWLCWQADGSLQMLTFPLFVRAAPFPVISATGAEVASDKCWRTMDMAFWVWVWQKSDHTSIALRPQPLYMHSRGHGTLGFVAMFPLLYWSSPHSFPFEISQSCGWDVTGHLSLFAQTIAFSLGLVMDTTLSSPALSWTTVVSEPSSFRLSPRTPSPKLMSLVKWGRSCGMSPWYVSVGRALGCIWKYIKHTILKSCDSPCPIADRIFADNPSVMLIAPLRVLVTESLLISLVLSTKLRKGWFGVTTLRYGSHNDFRFQKEALLLYFGPLIWCGEKMFLINVCFKQVVKSSQGCLENKIYHMARLLKIIVNQYFSR